MFGYRHIVLILGNPIAGSSTKGIEELLDKAKSQFKARIRGWRRIESKGKYMIAVEAPDVNDAGHYLRHVEYRRLNEHFESFRHLFSTDFRKMS